MTHRGRPVDLTKIKRVGLLTIEGEHDDISGVGPAGAACTLTRTSGVAPGRGDRSLFRLPLQVGQGGQDALTDSELGDGALPGVCVLRVVAVLAHCPPA